MDRVVLDTSAVLAMINGERGFELVVDVIDEAIMSAVNYAEVITKLIERGVEHEVAGSTIRKIGIHVVDFGIDLADRAAGLRAGTRHLGLSLADRACLALAEREHLPALTADRSWSAVDLGIEIRLIR